MFSTEIFGPHPLEFSWFRGNYSWLLNWWAGFNSPSHLISFDSFSLKHNSFDGLKTKLLVDIFWSIFVSVLLLFLQKKIMHQKIKKSLKKLLGPARESNPNFLGERQLCLPLYHRLFTHLLQSLGIPIVLAKFEFWGCNFRDFSWFSKSNMA